MERIVDNLEKKLRNVEIFKDSWVTRVEKTDSGQLKLAFHDTKMPLLEKVRNREYKHSHDLQHLFSTKFNRETMGSGRVSPEAGGD